MMQGDINNSTNQRMISIAIAFFVGLLLLLGTVDWTYSLWGPLTAGGVVGIALFYVAIALYKNWF